MSIFEITGRVVEGRRRGRELGFPTANLKLPEDFKGDDGVFGGVVVIGDRRYMAAICVGTQPMTGVRNLEVHCLDANLDDLYGQTITVDAIEFLRPMEKYSTEDELVAAIKRDVAVTRTLLTLAV